MATTTEQIDFTSYVLGETPETVGIATMETAKAGIITLIAQARQSICIQSEALQPAIYESTEVIEAVSRLARRHRWAHIQMLVTDADRVAARGHRLLSLAQRLDSHIGIRQINRERTHDDHHFVVIDKTGFAWFEANDRFEGKISFNDRATSVQLDKTFANRFEHGILHPGLKRLHI